jgi:hypothetical protein
MVREETRQQVGDPPVCQRAGVMVIAPQREYGASSKGEHGTE